MSTTEGAAVLTEMLRELRSRCPRLCPAVVPNGLSDAERGVALVRLVHDAAEKQALAELLRRERARVAAGGRCVLTSREVDEESALRFVSQWELQPTEGTYQLKGCDFVCAEAALLLDPAAMLERFTGPNADAKELAQLAQIFSDANQRGDEQARSALDARIWLQECLALANACKVVACGLQPGGWKVLDPTGQPLADTSVLAVARELLGDADTSQPSSRSSKGGSRTPRSGSKRGSNVADGGSVPTRGKKRSHGRS